jgi:hypothetical protein
MDKVDVARQLCKVNGKRRVIKKIENLSIVALMVISAVL